MSTACTIGASLSCQRWLLRPGGLESDGGLDQADGAQVEAAQRGEGGLHRGGDVLEAVLVEADAGQRGPLLDDLGGDGGLVGHGNTSFSLVATAAIRSSRTLRLPRLGSPWPPSPQPSTAGWRVCQAVAPW